MPARSPSSRKAPAHVAGLLAPLVRLAPAVSAQGDCIGQRPAVLALHE